MAHKSKIRSLFGSSVVTDDSNFTSTYNSTIESPTVQTSHDDWMPNSSTEPQSLADRYKVTFDGDNDPEDPLNWPLWYKWLCVIVLSTVNTIGQVPLLILNAASLTLTSNLATVLCLPAAPQILREFNTKNDLYVTLLGSIWELGEAVGPLLTAPISEIVGRAPVYNFTNTIFVIFSIACAVSSSPGMIIGFRFVSGMGDASIALNASIAGDLFKCEQRGLPIAILSFPPLLGPVLGPIIGGYLTQYAGWRWAFWFSAISGAVCALVFLALFRETYPPRILRRKASKIRKETSNPMWHSQYDFVSGERLAIMIRGFLRPMKVLFSSPIVMALTLQVSVAYGYMYIMFTTLTLVFERQYGFTQGQAGLSFLGLSIGMVIGVAVCALTLDRLLAWQQRRNHSSAPETRLWPMVVGTAIFPLGLFFYGWTAEYKVQPAVVPMIGTATVGLGYFITNVPLQAYFVDVFVHWSASAIAATVVVRCLIATVLPLAGPPLYDKLGLGWGNSLLGFIALLMIPIPLAVMKVGEQWRGKMKPMKT